MAGLKKISVTVNGTAHEAEVEPRLLLVHFIREVLRMTGTHIGCETTTCGACTVLLDGQPIKSCTAFAVQADGRQVMTVEGLEQTAAGPLLDADLTINRPDCLSRRPHPPNPRTPPNCSIRCATSSASGTTLAAPRIATPTGPNASSSFTTNAIRANWGRPR